MTISEGTWLRVISYYAANVNICQNSIIFVVVNDNIIQILHYP